ncbi:DUF4384 domain-containing protein [Hyphomicrobium sp.]|uniref:DUF4384 domain-containing protein n=1 Tax=Hyphomicrobium sp. TaxID=82 RepID=UPI0025BC4FEC|nr:DUF4384 domain-containing protein [Hyphomicrobium sp.]MCC7252502.1 DUF4384 domain-containing protein [Hyphomicrobium sp.]
MLASAALSLVAAVAIRAEPATAPPAAVAAEQSRPLPERARAVLEAHCTACREAHANGSALDLDALADDPRLVEPKRPDASRIYQRLLASQGVREGDAATGPTPEEVETVRDWIESLPARNAGCAGRHLIAPADADARVATWVRKTGASSAADTRFLSLVHLWNACAAPERLKEARDAVAILLAALARRRDTQEIETLGEEGAILTVRLSAVALLPAEWERLTASAPTAGVSAVPADWLAAHVLARPKDASGNIDPAFDVAFDAAGQRAVERFAGAWTRDVDLVRAAAERGVTPRVLAGILAAVGGEFLHPARRLIHGTLTREAWQSLTRALDGEAKPGSALSGATVSNTEIDVLVWTDKPFYRPRDLVTINVAVSKACHLTLIDVDREGKAIVLFPNELEPDNLIAPSVAVRVPGRDADYQFRFDRSGEEQIVAICQRASRRPDGIAYDYERQRFAILGDWRTFLRKMPEREKEIRAREVAEAARRKRRGRPPAANGSPAVGAEDSVPIEGRTAITVTIDRGTP